MRRLFPVSCRIAGFVAAILLMVGAIWPNFVLAAAPLLASLGQFQTEGMNTPGALDLAYNGHLFVADFRSGQAYQFDVYGKLVKAYPVDASGRGIAVSADGTRLYVAQDKSVAIVDVTSGELVGSLTGLAFTLPGEIALDAAGNVFVADQQSGVVAVFNHAGEYLTSIGSLGIAVGQFQSISGLTFNPAGQLVVTDTSSKANRTQVFTLDPADFAVVSVAVYTPYQTNVFGSPYMVSPRGVTYDEQSRAYFLNYLTSQIRVVSPTFTYLSAYGTAGAEPGQFQGVYDIVFDPVYSRLFVSCDGSRVEVVGVDGGQSPVYTNHAPTAPEAQSPVGGSIVDSANPTLVFKNGTDADGDQLSYEVIIRQGGDVVYQATVAGSDGESTSVTVVDADLEENAAFTWTVQAFDADTASAVSAPAGFVVNAVNEAPTAPLLIAPASLAEVLDGGGALTWAASTDPDPGPTEILYLVEIALDQAFAEIVADETVDALAATLGELQEYAALADDTGYYWRVTALDGGVASAPSAPGNFTYDTTMLSVTANVPGARVYLGGNHGYAGRYLGEVPLELRDVAAGAASIVVERPGFERYVAQLVLGAQENVSHYAVLVPAMVTAELKEQKNGINDKAGLAVAGKAVPFIVDFDNDGQLDMLVGSADGTVKLFAQLEVANSNRLSFAPEFDLLNAVGVECIPFVADWNDDGRKDLLVGLADGTVKLFLNSGTEAAPAFGEGDLLLAEGVVLDVGEAAAPAVVDFNGDDRKDLLLGNAAGQVMVHYNVGSDADPRLGAAVVLLSVKGAAVPFPVDWDADGQNEILVSADGNSVVYAAQPDGSYAPTVNVFSAGAASKQSVVTEVVSAFPIDVDGAKGKDVVVGGATGELSYLVASADVFVESFRTALLEKVDELAGLVADVAPEKLADVAAIGALLDAGDYSGAVAALDALIVELGAGPAQACAIELADLCR